MAAKIGTVFSQILTNLALPDGTGSYTYDLSGTDRVFDSLTWPIPQTPCVMIYDITIPRRAGPRMTSHEQTADLFFLAYVEATTDDKITRTQAAMNLLNDIVIAIESDRDVSGNAIEAVVQDAKAWGTQQGVHPSYGVAEGRIRITYRTSQGV